MKTFVELIFLIIMTSFLWFGMSVYDTYYGPNITTEKGKTLIQPFKMNGNTNNLTSYDSQDDSDGGLLDDNSDEQLLA